MIRTEDMQVCFDFSIHSFGFSIYLRVIRSAHGLLYFSVFFMYCKHLSASILWQSEDTRAGNKEVEHREESVMKSGKEAWNGVTAASWLVGI